MVLAPVPPKEAVTVLRGKVPVTKTQWQAMDEASRSRAFFVSGLARADMVAAVRDSLLAALESGQTLGDWKSGLISQFEKNGWQPLRSHHLNTIFRNNLASAYQAGRWSQFQRNKRFFGYLMYDAVDDSRTRLEHRALDGLVYPIDHEFWDVWYPPNDHLCRCSVRALTERQVKARSLKVNTDIPREVETDQGLVSLTPKPGFGGNTGKDWLSGLSPEPLDGPIRDVPISDLAKRICRGGGTAFAAGDDPCAPPLASLDRRHILPVAAGDVLARGLAPDAYVKAFLAEFGLKGLDESKVIALPGVGLPVVVSKGFFVDKRTGEWKVEKSGRAPYVKLLARTIQSPYEIWSVPVELSGKPTATLRLIRRFDVADTEMAGFAVFNLTRSRLWTAATAFVPKAGAAMATLWRYLDGQRVGTLVYREP
ncbi:phage head morphogenesis protein [Desulfovibrio sulfodismutans]|uniref:Phage head morphogenesis protein n=2 Tax=Desulfolutivibrio sulfodismutans TaxID=63561 RepID=A0A7K3NJN7_9BACT|nr:phage head morphogenesis protein [Desulfolutivibrio sulfodismutans]QLA14589.1 phage head morphogenesis protein [Desulfolutivibrio sulfodismutans DSM 3696]